MSDRLKITYIKSSIGRNYHQKKTIKALGLRRLHHSRIVEDTPSVRGMIDKVSHLLAIEPDTDSIVEPEKELVPPEAEVEIEAEAVPEPEVEVVAEVEAEAEPEAEIETETEAVVDAADEPEAAPDAETEAETK